MIGLLLAVAVPFVVWWLFGDAIETWTRSFRGFRHLRRKDD